MGVFPASTLLPTVMPQLNRAFRRVSLISTREQQLFPVPRPRSMHQAPAARTDGSR